MSPAWRAAWGAWASVSLILTVIWLITAGIGSGGAAYFWPVWVIGPWGALMLGRWILGAGGPHDRGPGRDDMRARHDMRDQLRAQRHQLRRDLRSEPRATRRILAAARQVTARPRLIPAALPGPRRGRRKDSR